MAKKKMLEDFCSNNEIQVDIKVYNSHDDYINAFRNGDTDMLLIGSATRGNDMRIVTRSMYSLPYV